MKAFYSFFLPLTFSILAVSCAKNSGPTVPNSQKPVIFFNQLPAGAQTGEADMTVMNWNDKTYYVGTDALSGGFVQARMISDFLAESDPAILDRNGDGIIGYVLCIGTPGHKDSRQRTEAVRKTLGTWHGSVDPKDVKDGSARVGEKNMPVRELDGKNMVGTDGTGWNTAAAFEAMSNWISRLGDEIDLVISNNDEMALACLQVSNYPSNLPIFGYDATRDALEALNAGRLTGTVYQDADAQVEAILQLVRNMTDGLEGEAVLTEGFTTPDRYGNKISSAVEYRPDSKSLIINSIAITKENCAEYIAGPKRDSGIRKITGESKRILYANRNNAETFLSTIVLPALKYYAPLYNINPSIVDGDGQNEASILDKCANLGKYDAYVLCMVKENSGWDYLHKLKY